MIILIGHVYIDISNQQMTSRSARTIFRRMPYALVYPMPKVKFMWENIIFQPAVAANAEFTAAAEDRLIQNSK